MKKFSIIFTVLACLLGMTNGFSFNTDPQFFDDQYVIEGQDSNYPLIKFALKADPHQIHIEENKISLDIEGVTYPLEKVYIHSGQLFVEGLINANSLGSEFTIPVKCPKCGREFLIGQGHTCPKE